MTWWGWALIGVQATGTVFCFDFLLREFWDIRSDLVFRHNWFNRAWMKAGAVIGTSFVLALIWWYTVLSTTLSNHFWPRFFKGPEIKVEVEETEEQGEGWRPTEIPFVDTAQNRADQMIGNLYDPYPDGF